MLKMKSISVIDTSACAQGHPIAGPLEGCRVSRSPTCHTGKDPRGRAGHQPPCVSPDREHSLSELQLPALEDGEGH